MHSYLQRTQQAIDEAVRGMSAEQMAWHTEGKWSTAQILEHLSLTYKGTVITAERCLRAGRPTATVPTWRDRVVSFVVTGIRYMPSGRQAPAYVVPRGVAPEVALDEVRRQLAAADDAISRCEAQFGGRVKIANHPILGPLTAQQWRTFHLVHARHHMKQIARLRRQLAAAK